MGISELIPCPQCSQKISPRAKACPRCGHPLKPYWGFEWKSRASLGGWPLVHVAVGRDKTTGKILVARGMIAVGQFAIGVITIAQFGIGFLFGFGQFILGYTALAQFAFAFYFGIGQIATGQTAIGQLAIGQYVLGQIGLGRFVWDTKGRHPMAEEYFRTLWLSVKSLLIP